MCYKGRSLHGPFSISLPLSQEYGEEACGNAPLLYLKMTPDIHSLHTYLRGLYRGAEVQVYLCYVFHFGGGGVRMYCCVGLQLSLTFRLGENSQISCLCLHIMDSSCGSQSPFSTPLHSVPRALCGRSGLAHKACINTPSAENGNLLELNENWDGPSRGGGGVS